MRTLQLVAMALLTLLAGAAPARAAGEVLDRVVATVNGDAILQSEWDDALRYEGFLNQRPLEQVTAAERRATLERLMDQLLLAQQMKTTGAVPATPDEVAERVREIRRETPGASVEAEWKAALARYGLTPSVLAERVARQLEIERYVDQRFSPSVFVDAESIENYYRTRLAPELQRSRSAVPPLAEVRARIERVLAEERVNELLSGWLKALRAQSRIEVK